MGKDKIYALLNEAIDAGYVLREKFFVNGLERIRYFVSEAAKFKKVEEPKERKSLIIYPLPENPDAENPDAENTDSKERIILKEEQKKESNAAPSVEEALSNFLLLKIKRNKENFSGQVNPRWIRFSKKLLTIRKPEELKKVIEWAMDEPFWSTVVQSPEGILNNLDKIEMQMIRKADPKTSRVSVFEENRKLCQSIQGNLNHKDIHFGNDYIAFNFGPNNYVSISYKENAFREQVENNFRKLGLSLQYLNDRDENQRRAAQ